jgi:transcriptional repressor NrdR
MVTGTLLVARRAGRGGGSRAKLLSGLRKACEKRPLPAGAVEAVADAVEAALRQRGVPEVPSGDVGELVIDHLRDLDQIAYIRFASVYREFADLEDVQRELMALAERGSSPGAGQPTLLPETELQALPRVRAFPRAAGASRGRSRSKGDTDLALGGRP